MRVMDVGTDVAGAGTRFQPGTGGTIAETTVGIIAGGIAAGETIHGGISLTAAGGTAGTAAGVGIVLTDGATIGTETLAGDVINRTRQRGNQTIHRTTRNS